jgi:hypothetical protein
MRDCFVQCVINFMLVMSRRKELGEHSKKNWDRLVREIRFARLPVVLVILCQYATEGSSSSSWGRVEVEWLPGKALV